MQRSAHRIVVILTFLVSLSATAMADRRDKPVQPRYPALSQSKYLIELWTGFEYQTPSGELRDNPQPDSDGKTDLTDDLGLAANPTLTLGARLSHYVPWVPDFRLDYTGLNFSGSQVLNRNSTISGVAFREGQKVTTTLSAALFDVTFLYDVLRTGGQLKPTYSLSLGLTARFSEAQLSSRGLGTWRVGTDSYSIPILPLLFVQMDLYPYRLVSGHLTVRGITDGTDRWIDGLAEVRTWPTGGRAWLGLGLRYQTLKVAQSADRGIDFQILAFIATLGIRF